MEMYAMLCEMFGSRGGPSDGGTMVSGIELARGMPRVLEADIRRTLDRLEQNNKVMVDGPNEGLEGVKVYEIVDEPGNVQEREGRKSGKRQVALRARTPFSRWLMTAALALRPARFVCLLRSAQLGARPRLSPPNPLHCFSVALFRQLAHRCLDPVHVECSGPWLWLVDDPYLLDSHQHPLLCSLHHLSHQWLYVELQR